MEINTNQIKKPFHKIILTVIFLFIILILVLFIYNFRFIIDRFLPNNNLQSAIINNKTVLTATSSLQKFVYNSDNQPDFFYYIESEETLQKDVPFSFFKISTNPENTDTDIGSFTMSGPNPEIITDSWVTNKILFVTNSETNSVFYSFDVFSQEHKPQEIFNLSHSDKNERVGDARFLDGGSSIAYVTYNDGVYNGRTAHSVLNIVSINNQQNKEEYLLNEKGAIYAGFGFILKTLDDRKIYLTEAGGDGGLSWSNLYEVNRDTKNVEPGVKSPLYAVDGRGYSTLSAINPDWTVLAYTDFSSFVDPVDLEQTATDYDNPCIDMDKPYLLDKYPSLDGLVKIKDLKTGTTEEVFKNSVYENNYCKNIANGIIDLKWLDNSRLAFETIDGMYLYDANTKQTQSLFSFENTTDPGHQYRPKPMSIQLPYILFDDGTIINTNSNKKLELFTIGRQFKHFFTFK